jgi:hypothetical protein
LDPLLATSVRSTKQTKPCVLRTLTCTQHAFPAQHSAHCACETPSIAATVTQLTARLCCSAARFPASKACPPHSSGTPRRDAPAPPNSHWLPSHPARNAFCSQHFSTLCVCPEPVLTNKSFSRFITQSECIDRWHLCQTKALFVRRTWQPGISHSGPQ